MTVRHDRSYRIISRVEEVEIVEMIVKESHNHMGCEYYSPYIGKVFELHKKTIKDDKHNNSNKTLSIQGN